MYLSVVVPLYNEEKNIKETARRVGAYLSLMNEPWELILVNDGSTDRTGQILREMTSPPGQSSLKPLHETVNHGKGFACRQGVKQARGRYVLLTDADLSSPIKEVDKLIAALEKGAQVACGSRALRAKDCDVQQSFKRQVSGRIFNFFVQSLVLPGVLDSQCGFKCFTREAAQKLFSTQKLDGFSFDVEVLYLARKFGYKIAEVPVMWSQAPESHVSLFRDATRMLKDLFKIKELHKNI